MKTSKLAPRSGPLRCECGFKGSTRQMETHFKNKWSFVRTEFVSGINKNGHTRAV